MSSVAQDWAWTQPVDGPRLLVLLALAKKVRPKTDVATPSMPELVHMTGMAESTVRGHIQGLAKDKVIVHEESDGGRHKRSRYILTGCLTPRESWGSKPVKTPREKTPRMLETPRIPVKNPPTSGPVVLRTNGEQEVAREAPAVANAAAQTDGDGLFDEPVTDASVQRDRRKIGRAIAERYCAMEPLSKYPAVFGVVMKALNSDRFTGEEVMAAVVQLATEGRGLTVETLRVQLVGFTPRTNGSRQTTRIPLRERLKGGAA